MIYFFRIFSSLKNFLIKKHSNDNFNEKEKNVDPNTEINKKELSFFEITEKKLLNFDDYKNIINFDEFQNITFEGIGEYYKGLSAFCLWKNSLDDEYCIISTLAGGLIFLKLNDGNHVLFIFQIILIYFILFTVFVLCFPIRY